jgi:hypothetical protein
VSFVEFSAVLRSNSIYNDVHDDDAEQGNNEVQCQLVNNIRNRKREMAVSIDYENCVVVDDYWEYSSTYYVRPYEYQ